MAAGVTYRVERGDAKSDRERVLALWEKCEFAVGDSARARYDWFYLDNPSGESRVYLLFAGDDLVGSLGIGTRRLSGACRGLDRAAILVDFVVVPAHRAMYPAMTLQRTAREQELRDVPLLYGIPATKAVPIFRRAGASATLDCGDHVRVLHSSRYLNRLLPWAPALAMRVIGGLIDRARLLPPWLICRFAGISADWQRDLPADLDSLAETAHRREDCTIGLRDRHFMSWRFTRSRGEDWQVLPVIRRGGQLIACAIGLRDHEELHIHDLLIGRAEDAYVTLQALALAARRMGVEAVRFSFGGCTHMQRTLTRAGYLLRDHRTCFLVQAPGLDAAALPTQWWLTRADEDV